MDVRLPDGTVISNVPDNIDRATLTAKLASSGYDVSGLQAQQPIGNRLTPKTRGLASTMADTPTGRLLTGITSAGGIGSGLIKGFKEATIDPLQNLSAAALHHLGIINDEQLKAYSTEQQQARQQYDERFKPSGAAEFVGAMSVPLPGGKITAGTKLAKGIKSAAQGTLLGGAAAAGTADVASDDYASNVATGMGLGALAAPAAGAATNLIGFTGRGVGNFIRNRYVHPGDSFLFKAVEKNPALGYETVSDVRAGMVPTAAPYAALQKTLPQEFFPTEFVNRFRAKSKQYIDRLANIGAKVPISELERRRDAITEPLWARFDSSQLKSDSKLESILSRYRQTIATGAPADIATIREQGTVIGQFVPAGQVPVAGLVSASGKPITKTVAAQYPEYLGSYLSDIRKDMAARIKGEVPEQAIASNLRGAVIGLRDELTKWMIDNSPSVYGKALNTHRRYGKLIDQKEVVAHLGKIMRNAVDEGQEISGSAFMRALDDVTGTLKRATGQSRYENLGELFNRSEMDTVNDISQSIAHQAHLEQRALSGAKADVQMATEKSLHADVLYRPVTVIEGVLRAIDKKLTEKVKREIAAEMLQDPVAAADRLEYAVGRQMATKARQKFISDAMNATRSAVKKPLIMRAAAKPSDQDRQQSSDADALRVKYESDRSAPVMAPPAQQQPPPYIDIYDMGEDYGVTPVAPEQ